MDGNILKKKELALASGVRASTIMWYSDIGLLPFTQEGTGLLRKYDGKQSLRRLSEIKKLQDKGLSINEILEKLKK